MNRQKQVNSRPQLKMGQTIKRFWRYMGKYHVRIGIASILALLGAIFNLLGPSQLSKITNLISNGMHSGIDLGTIGHIGLWLAGLYVLGFIVNYVQGFLMVDVAQLTTQDMRRDISHKIDRLPLSYFDKSPIGDTLSRVTNDVDTVGQMMNQSLSTLVSSLALLIGAAFMMLITNTILAIAGIIAAGLGILLSSGLAVKSQSYFNAQQTDLGRIDGDVDEAYSGLEIVKLYNAEKSERRRFVKINDSLYKNAWHSMFLSGLMMPLLFFAGDFAYVVVCILGAIMAAKGQITIGTIVAFMIYIRLFSQPLQNLAQAASSLQGMLAAAKRVLDFISEPEMSGESDKTAYLDPKQIKGSVQFDHVRFGYDPQKIIIHDFSELIKPGQTAALVGPTGAGKTTLISLLMRFYELNSGQIRIDGQNIADLKRSNVHALFGMVLQDTWLFEGTLRENLAYNTTNVTDEKLTQICQEVGLGNFLKQLPKGLDTVLNDNSSISAGQRQLITIARAMVANSPLIILDEATSSVDTRTELQVQQAMDNLTHGRTSFVIAHRLSTIRNADLIMMMEHGDVIETGTHESLMKKNGEYAKLYRSQFAKA